MVVFLCRLARRGQDHDDLMDCVHDGGAVGLDELLEGRGEFTVVCVLSEHDGEVLSVLLLIGR